MRSDIMKVCVEQKSVREYELSIITLENDKGHIVKLMDYGAALLELLIPDRDGKAENIILTYEKLEDYIRCSTYFGMICGRTSGRIAKGEFKIDGVEYSLNKNENGVTNLHGGMNSFSFRKWKFETFQGKDEAGVRFSTFSPDMEEGYPGNVKAEVTYKLNNENELSIDYKGSTDKATLLNMTNHAYFNLSGDYKRSITEHCLWIDADEFIELDETSIGIDVLGVNSTPMDFTQPKLVGQDINSPYLKEHTTNGYDHPWILNHRDVNKPQIMLSDESSGRVLSVCTTYPSVVVYSYNYPKNELLKGEITGRINYGICLETQYEPNGINYQGLNDAILRPDKEYREKTILKFSIK
jgi:aldose 1-epimerase